MVFDLIVVQRAGQGVKCSPRRMQGCRCWEASSWFPVSSFRLSFVWLVGAEITLKERYGTGRAERSSARCGLSFLDHHRHLHCRPFMMALDVNVVFPISWFDPNDDMISRRIYRLDYPCTEGTP